MADLNLNQAPEPGDPNYKETLLVREPESGSIMAVSDLKTIGNRREVHTTQPLSANKPGFYNFRSSNAVAAFITGFKSQKDAQPFQFLKTSMDKVSDLAQTLLRLNDNPKDEQGLKALRDHTVNPSQLERVKFDTHELPLAELQELGVVVSPQEIEAMKMGLPPKALHDATVQLGNLSFSGQYALHPYRDHNGEARMGFDTALAMPEFMNEDYKAMFSTSEKEAMVAGKTLDRLVKITDPHSKQEEWCHVGFNPVTNKLITVPKSEVTAPGYFNGQRVDADKKEILDMGGRVRLEGCSYYGSDNSFSGTLQYDVHTRTYTMSDYKFDRPYIAPSLDKQLDDKQRTTLLAYGEIDCSKESNKIFARNGKPLNCVLRMDRDSNSVVYDFSRQRKQEQDQRQNQGKDEGQDQDSPQKGQSKGRKR